MSWEDDQDWVPTDLTPMALDRLLDRNSYLMDKWDRMMSWHMAQRKWRHDEFVKAEAEAVMRYTGPATKAKYAAAEDPKVVMARTYLSIAEAQLGICERRLHSLEREAFNLGMRNKVLDKVYNNGGGSY
ncbi:hypothetical protein SSEA_SKINNY_61 [Mycobacterium phage Skinny]|uniref:Uncharacterized protein n=6 Tax=Bongovirus bongo TaxID=1983750 RepID=A0A0M4RA89_9CAUD|nr:hypothetical protein PEGLEG_59 [Mycobacterium phage PegLeg]YP_009604917.1 hypothetical protein FDH95_gp059 [Mycobacterium phage Bongo]ALF00587.1 hypothetical protein SEA_BRICOLE_59 [Mycobacterium phage Bricole]AXQ52700.1 hypothetical protein SEA_IPHANE7_59 [Mycobacterium phage IPhane7]QDH93632.1 hypothetical protein SEA_LILHOMIEP_58 [Mycobacterium phage LilhomieP]QGJ93206.1 hypothetical protein SEA_TYDAWG_59 [Mycobacterium phage TyDawg]QUU29259.1 hypothetical protein [Mycobacterium phage S